MTDWLPRPIIVPSSDSEREAVRHVQRVLRCPETGSLDEETKSHLLGFQMLFGIRATGVIDTATAEKIDQVRSWYST